jgi:protein-S-isoprenylcysteine O-methyltransferase Ste14
MPSCQEGWIMKQRIGVFFYGVVAYAISLVTFAYLAGFLGNFGVPRSIDSAPEGSAGAAVAVDLALLALFAVQHSVMARPGFKRWWTRRVPAEAERSTYLVFSNVALAVLFWLWRPIGGVVWAVEKPLSTAVLHAAFGVGWVVLLTSTFLINHFDLFGLRQVWLHLRGEPYRHLPLKAPGFYRHVRHPLYVGWLLIFWATPTMTIAHLVFALGLTAYILIAIRFEERDLVDLHGAEYAEYRRRVPMLVPRLGGTTVESPVVVPQREGV